MTLVERIGRWAQDKAFVEQRASFNIASLLHLGNFVAAVDGDGLVLRLSPEDQAQLLELPGTRPWRAGPPGRPVYAWAPQSLLATDDVLSTWLDKALAHVGKLPPKERLITKGLHVPEWKKSPAGDGR